MKNQLNHIIYALVILTIFGISFYWFGVRPAHIRSGCEQYAIDSAEKLNAGDDVQNSFYQDCLHQQGL